MGVLFRKAMQPLAAVVVVTGVLLAIGSLSWRESGPAGAPPTPSAETVPQQPRETLKIGMLALERAYAHSEFAAHELIAGRDLQIAGRVVMIDRDFVNDVVVTLASGMPRSHPTVTLTKPDSIDVAKLKPKQLLTVRCPYLVFTAKGPAGRECVFVSIEQ